MEIPLLSAEAASSSAILDERKITGVTIYSIASRGCFHDNKQSLQNAEPQHAEKEAEAVKEVSELGFFVAADVQREDHEADANHIAHDPQRDDERDRKAGHTVVLKEAEVRLLDCLRAEARGVCQRCGQTIHAHQVRRERRDEHTEGKNDQTREDRARLTADGAAARIRLEHNAI